jgi:hypothetical protein
MSRVDYVVVIQWWWCVLDADGVLGVAVGGVVVLFLVDLALPKPVSPL